MDHLPSTSCLVATDICYAVKVGGAHIALILLPLVTCCGCLIHCAGEVFVLDDGGEVDLDLGNYERFLDIRLTKENNLTTGKIYQSVINKERKGDYLGKTVQGESACSLALEDCSLFALLYLHFYFVLTCESNKLC